jgi:amino acid adenylation domain-containing protein
MSQSVSISAAFEHASRRFADRVALECDGAQLSYAELAAHGDRIARNLRARGVGRGMTVGLYAQRSPATIAAILGILKAGAAYLPLDAGYPNNLLRFIVEDSAPCLMLVQDSLLAQRSDGVFWGGEAVDIETLFRSLDPVGGDSELPAAGPEDVAYIMYTSGSTGRPKGVVIPHRAVLRLVIDNDFADFGPDQVNLQLAPLSFDASTFEIWAALLNGGKLAILSAAHPSLDDIAAAIAGYGVTTLWLTAGLFHLMVEQRLEALQPLRQLLAGGDVLSPAHVAKALRALPQCRLINGYGPTENTTFTCCYTIPRDAADTGPIPIGRPIAHTRVYILDELMRPVPDGEHGELYAGGAGVALGYLNRPELTHERFISDPFVPAPGALLYRSGDRVRRRADGNIEFMGRVDRQVKINGKRIELDEIESRLRSSGLVQDAAVTCVDTAAGQRYIAAFVTIPDGKTASVAALRAYLRQELPDYMIPPTIMLLEAFPLSPTGKVDRARLPAQLVATDPQPRRAAQNELESKLLQIWIQALGRSNIGVDDNFFDLGGTSLQLMQVHAIIRSTLASQLTVVEMFQFPNISALAKHLAPGSVGAAPSLSAQERARKQHAALGNRRSALKVRPQ